MDIQETYSEAEERFDWWRRSIGFWAGPLFGILVYFLPIPIPDPAHRLAALMVGMVIFWITEPIPLAITALFGPVLAILFGIGKNKEVIASFGNPVLFLFIGSFMIARAMEKHRLDRRFSFWLLSSPIIAKNPYRILCMLGTITAILSMWISNTAATAMIFPIALGILGTLSSEKGKSPYATGVMLMIAFAASVGGIATPIGSPPNLIGIGMIEKEIGRKISFFQWMQFSVPIVLVVFLILYLLLSMLFTPDGISTTGVSDFIKEQKKALGEWTTGEKNTLFVFSTAVFLWVLPGFLGLLYGPEGTLLTLYNERLPEGGIAILAASMLFFLPLDWKMSGRRLRGEFTLSWADAASIDWGTILLFGGGLAMGDLMFKTGLALAIGDGLLSLLLIQSLWGITGLSIALAIVVSELSSNTASANMVIPVVIAIAVASGVNPIPPALGATLGASFGFMLPISTPPNAIVYGSGLIPIRAMMRAGIVFDLVGFFVIWGGLRLLSPLLF